jgi:S1-C subfamily serine protease
VEASTDPAIAMARLIDAHAREARLRMEREVSGPTAQAAEKIAAIRFALDGANVYPDATFTLRLSFGKVAGWLDPVLGQIPAYTFTKGLWERATGAAPFNLAPKWAAAREQLNRETRFNLVSTNDIIGGNSGSPLVNLAGEIVGLVFDGNIHSLGGAYGFNANLNRTVSVASPIMLEALRKVYGADHLADELTVK